MVPKGDDQAFLDAVEPILRSLGAEVLPVEAGLRGDQPIEWQGQTVGYVRPGEIQGALERAVSSVERDLGISLNEMNRDQKQHAVRRLDQLGAFLLRGAVEEVAAMMAVSRVTLYAYLNAIRESDGS